MHWRHGACPAVITKLAHSPGGAFVRGVRGYNDCELLDLSVLEGAEECIFFLKKSIFFWKKKSAAHSDVYQLF